MKIEKKRKRAQLIFRIDETEKEKIKKISKNQGVSLTDVIMYFLHNNISLDDVE